MSNNRVKGVLKIAMVCFSLYFFLVSIGLMSVAFKGFGKGFAENLLSTTSNPFVGLFVGILATSIIQSSSTTTSIVVGMVASGIISVSGAIPIVMGANIGTTVTNLLVSLGHLTRKEEFRRAIAGAAVHDFFNQMCVVILFPLELMTGFLEKSARFLASLFVNFGGMQFTSPIKILTKPTVQLVENIFIKYLPLTDKIGYLLILFAAILMLYFSLFFIVKIMKSLVIDKAEIAIDRTLGKNAFIALLMGFSFTFIVQSSSITTSLLVPLIGSGIMTVESAFPITMGANIGTTGTAMLAAFATGNPAAIIIAFVHFLFNFIGVSFIYPIKFMRRIPLSLAKGLGNLAYRKRRYAICYIITVFFILPASLIFISKLFK
ncbi:MAG: Na/Pi symporter [Candidatus Omnitrophota bacterium]